MPREMIWRAASSCHDWRDGVLVEALLARAAYLGLLAPATWTRVAMQSEIPSRENDPRGLGRALVERLRPEGELASVEMGGDRWKLWFGVCPYENGKVGGVNSLAFHFDGDSIDDKEAVKSFMAAFRSVHTPDDTEYASVHPYAEWHALSNGAYAEPITTAEMFRGVFWANYLGPGQIDAFDLDVVSQIEGLRFKWLGSRGVFFYSAPSIADALAIPEKQLTLWQKSFRKAIRPSFRKGDRA